MQWLQALPSISEVSQHQPNCGSIMHAFYWSWFSVGSTLQGQHVCHRSRHWGKSWWDSIARATLTSSGVMRGASLLFRAHRWGYDWVDHLIKCLCHHCLSRARKVGLSCLKESRVEMLTWSVFTCKSIARGPGNYVIVPDFRMWRTSNWEGGPRSICWKTETWHTICTE